MLAGHYTGAFLAKAASPRTPLWVLLLAAQFVDVLWVLFVLAGIEHVRLDPTLPSNPLDLYHMPWTHSLAGTAGWALLYAAGMRLVAGLSRPESLLAAAVVVSHWLGDLVVHRPDLTIAGGDSKLGLALWNTPALATGLEIVLVAASAAAAAHASASSERGRRAWLALGAGLVLLQAVSAVAPLPQAVTPMVATTFTIYMVVAWAGRRVDRASVPAGASSRSRSGG